MTSEELVKYAIKNNKFVLFGQPYFQTETLELQGFEILIRIEKDNNIYNPSCFIDYIENSSFATEFDAFIINECNKLAKQLHYDLSANITSKSVNSNIQYKTNYNINLEITERIQLDLQQLAKFCANHNNIVIDDFGTGYNMLLNLKYISTQNSLKAIKIDYAFVKDMTQNTKILALIKGIINLAHDLGIKVIAEGVENDKQYKYLKYLGCDYVQGYLFGKPQDINYWITFVNNNLLI